MSERNREIVRDYCEVPQSMHDERCLDELLDLPMDSLVGSVVFNLFTFAADLDSEGDEHWRKAIDQARVCLHG